MLFRHGAEAIGRLPQVSRADRAPALPTVESMSATAEAAPKDTDGVRCLSRVPEGFATFFAVLGLLCLLLAFIPPLRRLLRPVVHLLDLVVVPVSANLAYAVFLFLLAAATAARKKIAWWLVVVYLGLLVLVDVLGIAMGLYAGSLPSLVVCALALGLLIAARREFYADSRRAAVRRALVVLFAGLVVAVLVGWGLVELFPGTLPRGQRLLWAADRVCGGLISGGASTGGHPAPLFFLLGLFGALALLNAAATLFRSQRMEAALHGDEEPRIRALLNAYGAQRLARLLRHPARQGRRLLPQRQGRRHLPRRGRGLPRQRRPGRRPRGLAARHRRLARRGPPLRLGPAVMGASEDGAKAYARSGLGALQLGDEAILHVAGFDLDGRDMRVTRQAVSRVRRTGATCRVRRHSALTDEEMEEIVDRADAWRDTETERGFSMALDRLGDPDDGDCLLVEALDARRQAARPAVLRALGHATASPST